MWRPLARTASQIRKECVDIKRGGVDFKEAGKQCRKLWGKKTTPKSLKEQQCT